MQWKTGHSNNGIHTFLIATSYVKKSWAMMGPPGKSLNVLLRPPTQNTTGMIPGIEPECQVCQMKLGVCSGDFSTTCFQRNHAYIA